MISWNFFKRTREISLDKCRSMADYMKLIQSKNEKENINQAERNELKELTSILVKNYKKKE